MPGYSWQNCENFAVPQNSVRYGSDDDGSVIYCGKAWFDGREVPAKIVPNKRECRVQHGKDQQIVPRCSKVLICKRSNSDEYCKPRRHHHRSHHHQHERDCCRPSIGCGAEETTITKTESNNENEYKTFVRTVKINSSRCTTTVKKEKKRPKCWTENRTRMVPKVTYEEKIRYEPKVHVEETVKYVPESYEITVCSDRCEPCRPKCREPCRERSCRRDYRCESNCCEEPIGCEGGEVILTPRKYSSPSRSF